MSNATVKVSVRGNPHPTALSMAAPFTAESAGTVDVPDTTVAGEFSIPFGAIGTECTFALLQNTLNQDVKIKINAASTTFRMAPGSFLAIGLAAASGGVTKLTAITFTTVATQSGDGLFTYTLCGDPV